MSFLAEVEELKKSPMPEVRETIALRVAEYFNNGDFEENEIQIAADIIRIMSKDVELRVRRALSQTLKANPQIPHDVVLHMAHDDSEVAVPVIEFSPVLTEGDILHIIRSTRQVAKLCAIARRENITEGMSSALTHSRNNEVVQELLNNTTAHISEESLMLTINEFKTNGGIINALIDRGDLPIGIAEKLINVVSGKMKEKLIKEYDFSTDRAEKAMKISQEKATLGLLADDENDPYSTKVGKVENVEIRLTKTEQLVRHLKSQGRLTQSLVLRSICEGNMKFFEASLAALAGTSLMNARTLLMDKNPSAGIALFKRAGIPESIIPSLSILLKFALYENHDNSSKGAYKKHLLEYIMSNDYDKKVSLMPYVIAIIGSKLNTDDLV